VRNRILPAFLVIAIFSGDPALADSESNVAIDRLAAGTVSRLEWGIEKLNRALVETFAIDPLTLEPSSPPYFVNVSFEREEGRILVEIGRTFASVKEDRAKELCSEYIARVRGMLSVGQVGRPSIGSSSSLAADFFHPMIAVDAPDIAFAQALDRAVVLRALVASPVNGVFSICTAQLTHSPVRQIE